MDGTIYITSCDCHLYAVNSDGTQKWAYSIGDWASSPVIGADGTIYFVSDKGILYAINPNGPEKWAFASDSYPLAPAIGADGTIYVGSCDGHLYAVNPNGTQKWEFTNGHDCYLSAAIGADGTIYCGSDDGHLYAIGATTGTVTVVPKACAYGAIVPDTPQTVAIGANLTFTTTANAGYTTDTWYLDEKPSQTGGVRFSLSTLTAYHTLYVTFKPLINPGHGDWWMFRHDPQHTGRSPFTGPAAAAMKWAFPTKYQVESTPTLGVDGTIYFGSGDCNLYAVNPDGTQKWAFATASYVISSPALGVDGTIYVGSNDGYLYAINDDGTKKWAFATGSEVYSSPAIGADGTIYVGSYDNNLYAINPNGTQKWEFFTAFEINSSPAIDADGTIYVGSSDSHLYAINPISTQKWTYATGGNVESSPALGSDGTIYVGSNDGCLYAINHDGTKKWAFATGGEVYSSPALGADGTIYIGSIDQHLYAIKPDGTQKWAFATEGQIYSSPALGADGTIYVGSDDGNLYAVKPDGTKKWAFTTGFWVSSSPAIGADGTIYVGSKDDSLYAIVDDVANITPSAGPYGSISPNTVQTVTIGMPVTFTAAANAGHTVIIWTLDGDVKQTGGAQYTVQTDTFIAGSTHSLNVLFIPPAFTITPSTGTHGDISPNTLQKILYNDSVTFTATANAGYTVDNWLLDGKTVQNGGIQYKLTHIVANHDVRVTFRLKSSPGTGRGDWWMFQHDPQHSGRSSFTGPATATKKWAIKIGWAIRSSPAFGADGTIYIGSDDGHLYAINPNSTQKWACSIGGLEYPPAIGADGTLYVGSRDGHLYAVNPDGTQKWAFDTIYSVFAPPAIDADGTLYVGSMDGHLYAVNSDGTVKWTLTTRDAVTSSPAIGADGTIYVGSDDGSVYAIGGDVATITPSAGANGTISPNSPQTALLNSKLIFTAKPNAGYRVDAWKYNGTLVYSGGKAANGEYTGLTLQVSVTGNGTVYVAFTALNYTITPSAGANGVISPNMTQRVSYNGSLTFTATANAGYTAVSWLLDGAQVQAGGATYTLMNVTANHAVKVLFAPPASKPDLSICNNGDTGYLGLGIIGLDGTNQTKVQTVAGGATATYFFRVQNSGNITDTFTLTCPLPAQSGWTVQVIDKITGKDITAAITGAGYTTVALAPGVAGGFTLKVTPSSVAVSGKAYALLITGVSVKDKKKKDAVKAVTTKQ